MGGGGGAVVIVFFSLSHFEVHTSNSNFRLFYTHRLIVLRSSSLFYCLIYLRTLNNKKITYALNIYILQLAGINSKWMCLYICVRKIFTSRETPLLLKFKTEKRIYIKSNKEFAPISRNLSFGILMPLFFIHKQIPQYFFYLISCFCFS